MAPRDETPTEDWQVQYAEMQLRSAHLYRTREWADCTFQFQTTGSLNSEDVVTYNITDIHAHKLILAMVSPVFAAMFYGTVGDQKSPVTVTDIDLPTFSALLQYIYTEKTDIPDVEAAMNLYKAANKYILVHLEKICLDYLFDHLNPHDVCQIYEFARLFGLSELEKKCLEMFSTETQLVLKGSGFRKAAHDTVKKIVSMDALDIDSEVNLLDALLEYLDNFKQTNNKNSMTVEIKLYEYDMECLGQGDTHTNDPKNQKETSENMALLTSSSIFEEERSILKGLIEEIRFLSMSPTELAKIVENTKVLSEHEITALFTNMFSPNSSISMPFGFSCKREPRVRVQTLCFTVNVASLRSEVNNFSPPCYVRRLRWRILAKRKSITNEDYLGVFLKCDTDHLHKVSDKWSSKVKSEFRLLSINPEIPPIVKSGENKFCSKSSKWGWSKFIEWEKLIDPTNSFIKDGFINLEVHLTAQPVEGADLKQFQKFKSFVAT